MDFYCDHCGYHARFGRGMAPFNVLCQICGIGHMRQGECDRGFRIVQNAIEAFVPDDETVLKLYKPAITKGEQSVSQLNYFAGVTGKGYKKFIQTETIYLGRFNKILLPEARLFSWLSPYTGNKHNQRHFTQAALAKVAIAQFKTTGVFPRLIEPFVGSGQVFLNACHWGPYFNQGIPLFQQVIGGDLNPYVVAAFNVLREHGSDFVQAYLSNAERMDKNLQGSFDERLDYLDTHGNIAATGRAKTKQQGSVEIAVMSYIYVVNRCVHGTKLNGKGGVTATPKLDLNLKDVRKRERQTLINVCKTIGDLGGSDFRCQDFAKTCALAKPSDIVFMDCPFPKFTTMIPSDKVTNPEVTSTSANTYGVGEDGAGLQSRIVTVASELIEQGTTVILCNFANAGLVRAYTNLLQRSTGIPVKSRRSFTFTYCSPATTSEAYLLTILPGKGAVWVNDVPNQLRALWQKCGGDDNFGPESEQEYFTSIGLVDQVQEPKIQDWNKISIEIKESSSDDNRIVIDDGGVVGDDIYEDENAFYVGNLETYDGSDDDENNNVDDIFDDGELGSEGGNDDQGSNDLQDDNVEDDNNMIFDDDGDNMVEDNVKGKDKVVG